MSKQTTKTTASRKTVILDEKRVLRELDKLQKYRNGMKCNRSAKDERYGPLASYTGHLKFADVIAVISKLSAQPEVKKTTTKKATR